MLSAPRAQLFKQQEILDIWSPYVTTTKLRRGGVYYYESLMECPIQVGIADPNELTSIGFQNVADMVSHDGRLFRPIALADGTLASVRDLTARPTTCLIGRTGDPDHIWWVDHPAALYLADQDLPPREPLLRPPSRGEWWGDQSLMTWFDGDLSGAERRAGELNGKLLIVGDLPMRHCHLPGVAIDAASGSVTLRQWIFPHPRPFAPFTAYLPSSQTERSLYLDDGVLPIALGQLEEPEPQAAGALADWCTLAAAFETVFGNLKAFDQTAISYLTEERAGLVAALAREGQNVDSKISFLAAVLTGAADERLQRYGWILNQTVAAKGLYDEDLANL